MINKRVSGDRKTAMLHRGSMKDEEALPTLM